VPTLALARWNGAARLTDGTADGLLTGLGAGLAITGDPHDAAGSQPMDGTGRRPR
jgi:hypothetical protein